MSTKLLITADTFSQDEVAAVQLVRLCSEKIPHRLHDVLNRQHRAIAATTPTPKWSIHASTRDGYNACDALLMDLSSSLNQPRFKPNETAALWRIL